MIYLQFVRQAALTSDLIAWLSQGHVSHVDCVLPNGNLLGSRSDRVGGKPVGVQIRPPDYEKFILKEVLTVPAKPKQERDFYTFLDAQLGKPYDHAAIWGFVTGRNWRDDDSWICSELQAAGLEAAGIVPPLYLAANKISPGSLALAVSAIGAGRMP